MRYLIGFTAFIAMPYIITTMILTHRSVIDIFAAIGTALFLIAIYFYTSKYKI